MNTKNEIVSANCPRAKGFILVPHHTIAYSTKTAAHQEFKLLIEDSTFPVPIFTINYRNRTIRDPAREKVIAKQKLDYRLDILKQRCLKEQPPEGTLSENFLKYVELAESNETPHIGTEVDSRFLGGNLETFKIGNELCLAQPSMCDIYDLRILNRDAQHFKSIDLPTTPKHFSKDYSFEIMSSSKFIGIRKNKSIKFIDSDWISASSAEHVATAEFHWNREIVASCIRAKNLIVVDSDYNLLRVNIENLLVDISIKLPETIPNHRFPVSLSASFRNVAQYTNLKSFNFIDIRSKDVTTVFDHENFVMKCEELTYHKRSFQSDLIFLASSHLLYGIDQRMPKKILMHWNHQMIMQPTMMKSTKFSEDEVICLSSNLEGDIKIFNVSKSAHEGFRRVNLLPYKPRRITQSYRRLRAKGQLLLSDPIKHRVNLSTTGIALIAKTIRGEIEPSVELYTQNSLGDVFKTNLHVKPLQEQDEARLEKNFHDWDEAIKVDRSALQYLSVEERINEGDLHFTDIVNLRGLSRVMRCEQLQATGDETDGEGMLTQKVPRWKTDLEDEKEYRDVLSQFILNAWDLDIEDTQPKEFAEALAASKKMGKDGKIDKVAWWLESSKLEDSKLDAEIEVMLNEPMTQGPTDTQKTEAKKLKTTTKRIKGF